MINLASPHVRATLPIAKSTAIMGNPSEGISMLEGKISASSTPIDQIVLLIAICEILHFDYRDTEALNVFQERVVPLTGKFPEKIELAVSYNRSDIMRSLFKFDDFYGMVDRASITDIKLWDHEAYFSVIEAREKGKRYNSLPIIWRELIRSYNQGCWSPYRLASKLMAIECMDLGWPHEAVYHAIMSGEIEAATKLGTYLLQFGTPESISTSTKKWLECTFLKRLFMTGCEILDQYVDAVPAEMFDEVFERVRKYASMNSSDRQEHTVVSRAWDSLLNMSWRLNPSQAERLVNTAIGHSIWNAAIEGGDHVLTVRDKLLQSLTQCAARLLPETLTGLIKESLTLFNERKQHSDYPDAIRLLCSLASVGGEEAKQQIKKVLFPSGQPLDAYRLQVASHFGVELTRPDSLNQDAKYIADRIRKQVQTLPLEAEVKQLPDTFGFHTTVKENEKLVVHMANSVEVNAILRHRNQLSDDALQSLIDAILGMINENENLLSNKIQLVQSIASIGDSCSDAQARQIFKVLEPLANGDITEPESAMSAAESQNPLNPFKMGSGKPTDLRGVAIYTLACIEREKPTIFAASLDPIIELGLTDDDPQIRTLSIAAAKEKPSLSEAEFTAIILSTRDTDPNVASAAFGALANKKGLQLTRPQWRLLIHSAKLSVRSSSVVVRRAAAYTCATLRSIVTTRALHNDIDEILNLFCSDKCDSVRRRAVAS